MIFLTMASVSPPFVLFIPNLDHNCFTKAHEFVACNNVGEKKPHSFHVRIPVILNDYLGTPCVEGLICKGFK